MNLAPGDYVTSYRNYEIYCHTGGGYDPQGGFCNANGIIGCASLEIRPPFDNTTWSYLDGLKAHIDAHLGTRYTPELPPATPIAPKPPVSPKTPEKTFMEKYGLYIGIGIVILIVIILTMR